MGASHWLRSERRSSAHKARAPWAEPRRGIACPIVTHSLITRGAGVTRGLLPRVTDAQVLQ